MKKVVQEDPMGCGIACTASIMEVTYQAALELFPDGKQKAKTTGFYCKDIILALQRVGLNYKFRWVGKALDVFHEGTIVYVKKSLRYPAGHYLVRAKDSWMDPWINFPKVPRKAGLRKKLPEIPQYAILAQTVSKLKTEAN